MDQTSFNSVVRNSFNLPSSVSQGTINRKIAEMNSLKDQYPGDSGVSISSSAISAVAATDRFESTPVNFVNEGITVGCWINVSGFTESANNGTFKVTAVDTGYVAVDGSLANEAVGDAITITCELFRRDLMNAEFGKKNNLPSSILPS